MWGYVTPKFKSLSPDSAGYTANSALLRVHIYSSLTDAIKCICGLYTYLNGKFLPKEYCMVAFTHLGVAS